MKRARHVVLAMGVSLVTLAYLLDRVPIAPDSWLARLAGCELTHLVAHTILYGTLSVALASWWLPRATLDGARPARVRAALGAASCFALIAGAQELTQALCRGRLPAGEELFDGAVDVAAATVGLIAWARADARRRWPVAHALGAILHPAVVGPAGVFALSWSALRDARAALAWTLAATLAMAPVAALWGYGLRRGWYSDRDLSVRAERPGFLLCALAVAAAFAAAVHHAHAPSVIDALATAGLVATALVTAATLAGLKVSGHVAVPVGALVLMEASTHRGLWPFALVALALSWARVREGRHTRVEVLAGWGIAGASGLLVRLAG